LGFNVDVTESRTPTFCLDDTQVDLIANASTFSCPDDTGTTNNNERICLESPTAPGIVNASTEWYTHTIDGENVITIRTTFSKTFVDNTYGTGAIGWPSGHTFSNLTGSDKLELALYDNNNVMKLQFYIDYISSSSAAPSGYKSLGVSGGEGSMVLGSAANIVSCMTSIDKNLNELGYHLLTNSPTTDASYTPNSSYPDWIYDVWYEVTVKESAFGAIGFGKPEVTYIHASPSKTGHNSETVLPVICDGSFPGQNTGSGNTTPASTYLWSTGATTSKIHITTPGTYTVTATNTAGCENTKTVVVESNLPTPLNDYVILTREHLKLDHSTVYSGGLGVTNYGTTIGKLEVINSSNVTASTTFAQSSNLIIGSNAQVTTQINDGANVDFPVFEPETYNGTKAATVPDNATAYLSDTLYKTITIGKNATAILTKPIINVSDKIVMGDNSTLKFAQCGKILVRNTMTCGANVHINPDEKFVKFYVGSDLPFKAGSHVNGNFYLGDIVGGDTSYHHMHIANSTAANPGVFKGTFLAQCVHSGTYTNWYKGDFCGYCPPPEASAWECPSNLTLCDGQENFVLRDLYPPEIQGVSLVSNNQPETFPIGTTTVTWTVVDNYGTTSHCTQLVTRSAPITVVINKDGLFCENSYKLKATITQGIPTAYLWSTGETTPNIIADVNGGDYSITVTNSLGCDTSYAVNMSADTTDMIPQYVLYAKDKIEIKRTTVNSGALGVLTKGAGKECNIKEYSTVNNSQSFVKANKINVDASSSALNKLQAISNIILPVFECNTYPSTNNVSIAENGNITLDDTIFGTITVNKNATVTFNKEIVNIQTLVLKEGATVKFGYVCGKLRVKNALTTEKRVTINPEKKSVLFYVENNVTFNEGINAYAIFYLGNAGKLDRTFDVNDYTNTRPNIIEGMILAKTITIGKYTTLDINNFCQGCTVIRDMKTPENNSTVSVSGIELNNYPNPFVNTTSLFFTLPENNHVTLDVYDVAGKRIATLFDGFALKNQQYKVDFDGSKLPAGIYMYKMATDKEVLTGKMTMLKL